MKVFSGFPAGKLQVTPLPNVFFTDLLLTIDDLAELKLTLHLFWLLAERAKGARSSESKSRAMHIRESELRADPTLMQSLKAVDAMPEQALLHALARATERGTLLRLRTLTSAGEPEEFYFLNTETGRRMFGKLQREAPPPDDELTGEPSVVFQRPNVFELYEQNIGPLTPMIADTLKQAEEEYGPERIERAMTIAVRNNVRRWTYVEKILENWRNWGEHGGRER